MTKEEKTLKKISSAIKNTEFENHVFLAGGAVRDELLGLPIKDLDLTVSLENGGIRLANFLISHFNESQPIIFERFGTANFKIDDVEIESVMTRKESYTNNSRKPQVEPGSLKEDVLRRDFTINSLVKNVSNDEILDLTKKGLSDLKNKIIRTPLNPDETFSDDPLRMLRAIRFVTRFNWNIPLYIIKSLKKNSYRLKIISRERIQGEFNKIIKSNYPVKGIELLRITNLLKYIIPELYNLIGLEQNEYHKDDAYKHTLDVLSKTNNRLELRLAALLHDIGKFECKSVKNGKIHFYRHDEKSALITIEVLVKLKYSSNIIQTVSFIIEEHMRTKSFGNGVKVSDKAIRKLKSDLGDHLDLFLDLVHADNLSHTDEHILENQVFNIKKRIENLRSEPIRPNLPINGYDIMKLFSLSSGKKVGKLLKIIEETWFENPNITKREAIKILRKLEKK